MSITIPVYKNITLYDDIDTSAIMMRIRQRMSNTPYACHYDGMFEYDSPTDTWELTVTMHSLQRPTSRTKGKIIRISNQFMNKLHNHDPNAEYRIAQDILKFFTNLKKKK